jgi:hypothetical protein
LKLVEQKGRPKLLLSKEIQLQIDRAHTRVGAREWSGILFFSVVRDTPDVEDLELKAEMFFPMDVGSEAFTSFDANHELLEIYRKYPQAMELRTGLIHTHHTMSSFFSSVDERTLLENARFYPFYLSLIMSMKTEPIARIAVHSKVSVKGTETVTYGTHTTTREIDMQTEQVLYWNCEVFKEVSRPAPWFTERLENLAKKAGPGKPYNVPQGAQRIVNEDLYSIHDPLDTLDFP